jgi:hypothetical protein
MLSRMLQPTPNPSQEGSLRLRRIKTHICRPLPLPGGELVVTAIFPIEKYHPHLTQVIERQNSIADTEKAKPIVRWGWKAMSLMGR